MRRFLPAILGAVGVAALAAVLVVALQLRGRVGELQGEVDRLQGELRRVSATVEKQGGASETGVEDLRETLSDVQEEVAEMVERLDVLELCVPELQDQIFQGEFAAGPSRFCQDSLYGESPPIGE